MPTRMMEVIVCTLEDAMEAQAGGADRLELVRDLESGGLTPEFELANQIVSAVQIPVRVMLRENSSMQVKDDSERQVLLQKAAAFRKLKIDGIVTGFVRDNQVDWQMMNALVGAAAHQKITFHRAFDTLPDPVGVIAMLKKFAPVDRILTDGGSGAWPERLHRLQDWQRCAGPEISILAAAGLSLSVIADLQRDAQITEIHLGRAARMPPETYGVVKRERVAELKGLAL